MDKRYDRINWEDFPSKKTPFNAENMNKMDSALNELDDRIVEMNNNVTPINNLVTTVPGRPLDAVVGKMLNDKLTAIENALLWKVLKTVTGSTAVSLANIEFNELIVTVKWGNEVYPFHIPKADLTSAAKTYYNGKVSFQNSSTPYATEIRVTASLSSVSNSLSMANNASWTRAGVTADCTTTVYYR